MTADHPSSEDTSAGHRLGEDPLFAPVRIGHLTLANGVALAPMTRVSANADGTVSDRSARYYERFACGGFGLVITEGIYPDSMYSQGYLHQPGLATDGQADSWQPVVESVHAAGAPIVAQLMHAGSQSQGNQYSPITAGPSAVAPKGQQLAMYRGSGPFTVPQAMGRGEVAQVREGFVAAARRAVAAGFDGVEIHGANGYLLDQFLTDYLNLREDEYGGSLVNRVRLLAQVCADVVDAVGSDAVVGVRISQGKVSDANHRWGGGEDDAEMIFNAVGDSGVHYVHTTEYDALAAATTDGTASLAALAKRHGTVPVIANGQLGDPDIARSALRSGAADVVALGKPALADRNWANTIRQGETPCTELHPDQFGPLADIKDFELTT